MSRSNVMLSEPRGSLTLSEARGSLSEARGSLSEAKSLTRSFAALRATQEDKEGCATQEDNEGATQEAKGGRDEV